VRFLKKTAKYYYNKLSNDEQWLCNTIVDAIFRMQNTVTIRKIFVDNSVFQKVFEVINWDFPEIFYLDNNGTRIISNGISVKVELKYLYNTSAIESYLKRIKLINSKFDMSYTDRLENLKEIHDFLVKYIKYQTSVRYNECDYSLVGSLCNQTSVCEGYAKAFKFLCEQNGILCMIVTGEAISRVDGVKGSHAWNIVKIGGTCSHIDLTWDSCLYHEGSSPYVYYMQSDAEMECDHFWDNTKVPICKGIRQEVPLCHNKNELDQVICNNINNGVFVFSVRVTKRFETTKDIIRQTEKLLQFHPSIHVTSFSVSYLKERQQIEYRFSVF